MKTHHLVRLLAAMVAVGLACAAAGNLRPPATASRCRQLRCTCSAPRHVLPLLVAGRGRRTPSWPRVLRRRRRDEEQRRDAQDQQDTERRLEAPCRTSSQAFNDATGTDESAVARAAYKSVYVYEAPVRAPALDQRAGHRRARDHRLLHRLAAAVDAGRGQRQLPDGLHPLRPLRGRLRVRRRADRARVLGLRRQPPRARAVHAAGVQPRPTGTRCSP